MKKIAILSIIFFLSSCDKPIDNESSPKSDRDLVDFINKAKKDFVFVQGGDFLMGDFGVKLHGVQIDPSADSKPLHKVELTGFSINKFKISNHDYHIYLSYNHLNERMVKDYLQKEWIELNSTDNTPARIDWYEANNYCAWLGKVTNLPISLPTEAQWEYASRSRGEFKVLSTDTGEVKIKPQPGGEDQGINVATEHDREVFSLKSGTHLKYFSSMPGDAFPPNPLGIYDMTANGFEWVNDWYDPNYYQQSPLKDPQGPDKPIFKYREDGYQKVMRSVDRFNGITGSTVGRTFRSPKVKEGDIPPEMTARCVVNSPIAIE